MAVLQANKQKVRPVMDYRALNKYVDAHPANADVCAQKLREWRQKGSNVAVLDLRRAYLQVHVDKSLWPFQKDKIEGQRYCLTRLGFGLNVTPIIMRSIINMLMAQDETIQGATSSYIDDIFVNESACTAARVRDHLQQFGLTCKDPKRLRDGTRVLGLHVMEKHGKLQWCRGGELPMFPDVLTRRGIFSLYWKLMRPLPVCGWLRVATAFVRRRANSVTAGWDDEPQHTPLIQMLSDIIRRMAQKDPMQGDWSVDGREVTVWIGASSLATGVVVESVESLIEDACWLRPAREDKYINLAELDAMLRGINMALQWKATVLHLKTDSACVHRWITDALSGKARIRTKAASEMLIRRRLSTIKGLVVEYELTFDVELVRSQANRADQLTRVSQRWLDVLRKVEEQESTRIRAIHQRSGHPDVRWTLYFVRQVSSTVSKAEVLMVVRASERCQSVDPALVHWKVGKLDVRDSWRRVGMDITHYEDQHYSTLIDCGPSMFSIRRPLQHQNAASIIRQMESVFSERGPPAELLTDNGAAFSGEEFGMFAENWGIQLRFRCAYVPSGNGIVERYHRTIKRIAARIFRHGSIILV